MPHSRDARYEVMANDDDYDPANPKFIKPATQEQMEHASTEQLGQQIERLETMVERRSDSKSKTFQHYEHVLAEMRYEAGRGSKGTHVRMRSDPAKRGDNPVTDTDPIHPATLRTFTHARIRSAPVGVSGCDIVPQDDKPLHINRVQRTVHSSPGEQLIESTRTLSYGALLGPAVRPPACVSPKMVPNPARGPLTRLGRGPPLPHPSTPHMTPGEQLRNASCLSPKSPQKGAMQRKRPSTPPLAKSLGPTLGGRRSQGNFVGGMCGDLADESINEFVVPSLSRPCIGARVSGVTHLMHL